MIALTNIGTYLPENRISNLELLDKFSINEVFIREKIGVIERAIKTSQEKSSDLCIKAFDDLSSKTNIKKDEIDCCIVVTQNPDTNIPHTSAIVHGAIGLPESCACFDISLGCSGYVYALSIITSFMQSNNFKKGLLFTSDPYSDIIDHDDKGTELIFGDGATVTLLSKNTLGLHALDYDFGSRGSSYQSLVKKEKLYMNGRAVFNFTASVVPHSITKLLHKNELKKSDINRWYFHQGSKYILDTISMRLGLETSKVVFDMLRYGNTVSSSIPMLLAKDISKIKNGNKIVLSGFGVGLSWASAIFEMKNGGSNE